MNDVIFSQPDFSVKPAGRPADDHSLVACFSGMRVLLNKETMLLPDVRQLSHELAGFELFELAHAPIGLVSVGTEVISIRQVVHPRTPPLRPTLHRSRPNRAPSKRICNTKDYL